MAIIFKNVSPVYLEEEKIQRSEVWNRELRVEKNINVQVTAPSGSGKTSFIHFLYGVRQDYSGEIIIDEKNLTGAGAEEISLIRRSKLSIVFQDMRLFTGHTLWENIIVKHALEPYHKEESIRIMAARLGVETKLHQQASKCSYGEQQRAAIIRALQQPFDYLLLDEPFSHLDDKNSLIAMQLILEEAAKRNATIIMADLEPNSNFPANKTLHL